MTDKQIIIDGVDVSECDRYIANDGYMGVYNTPVFKGDCKLSHIGKCQGSECLFKRFKRKEQKLEKIKEYCNNCNLKADFTACDILQIIEGEEDGK